MDRVSTVEPQCYEPLGETMVFAKSEISVTLKSSAYLKILYCSHEEYAAMITIQHKLADTEATAL